MIVYFFKRKKKKINNEHHLIEYTVNGAVIFQMNRNKMKFWIVLMTLNVLNTS